MAAKGNGVAEADRPGRLEGLDNGLLHAIEAELGLRFHPSSNVIARGRVSAAVALLNARTLIYQGGHHHVLIAGVDSFLNGPTLAAFEARERLLTSQNSNGFIPGEGAAAVVLAAPFASEEPQLACIGLGFGVEKATVEAEDIPLRAEGLTQAVRDYAMRAPHYDLDDLSNLDGRIDAHLDGLRVAGTSGLETLLTQLSPHAIGEMFASAVLVFEAGNAQVLSRLSEHLRSAVDTERGYLMALGWLDWEWVSPWIDRMLASPDPLFRRLGLAACGMHRLGLALPCSPDFPMPTQACWRVPPALPASCAVAT